MRSRKPVNYSFEDPEDVYGDDSFDQSNQTGPIKENLSHIHGACEDGATDFSMRKECSTADFPLKENLPPDSHESEGLFCMDAGETSHPATGNHNSSDDYLKMGGGFCLDDDDDKVNVNTSTVDDTANFPHCSDCLDGNDRDKNSSDILFSGTENAANGIQDEGASCKLNREPNDFVNAVSYDHSDIGALIPEDHNNSGASTRSFSAMPFLRKKRKN